MSVGACRVCQCFFQPEAAGGGRREAGRAEAVAWSAGGRRAVQSLAPTVPPSRGVLACIKRLRAERNLDSLWKLPQPVGPTPHSLLCLTGVLIRNSLTVNFHTPKYAFKEMTAYVVV